MNTNFPWLFSYLFWFDFYDFNVLVMINLNLNFSLKILSFCVISFQITSPFKFLEHSFIKNVVSLQKNLILWHLFSQQNIQQISIVDVVLPALSHKTFNRFIRISYWSLVFPMIFPELVIIFGDWRHIFLTPSLTCSLRYGKSFIQKLNFLQVLRKTDIVDGFGCTKKN